MPMPLINREQYINMFNHIHKNKYDYSKSIFRTQKDKFMYVCPIHNEIEQTLPLHKKYGCPICFNTKILKEKEQNFIAKAVNKFGNRFTYNSLNFKSLSDYVNITCSIHGDFSAVPKTFLLSKNGCNQCSWKQAGITNRLTKDEMIIKANQVHRK